MKHKKTGVDRKGRLPVFFELSRIQTGEEHKFSVGL